MNVIKDAVQSAPFAVSYVELIWRYKRRLHRLCGAYVKLLYDLYIISVVHILHLC